jgi:hypothetical protein
LTLPQGGALALRRVFQHYDRSGLGALPAAQFRLALEKRFQVGGLYRIGKWPIKLHLRTIRSQSRVKMLY